MMGRYKFKYNLWELRVGKNKKFPFTYKITAIDESKIEGIFEKYDPDLEVEYDVEEKNLKEIIHEELLSYFPFYRYMDVNSNEYIGRDNDLKYLVKIKVYHTVEEKNRKGNLKKYRRKYKTWAVILNDFDTDYQFNLITSLEQLESVLADVEIISFDTEDTGLNPEEDYIVGASFSMEPKIGYYLPVRSDEEFFSETFGYEGLDILYDALCRARLVLMFNAEFDMRMMRFSERHYDFSEIDYFDVQLSAWYMDPDNKQTSLKWFEKYFLGYYRKDLLQTMRSSGLDSFNTAKISPRNILFYAAQDAVSTLELFYATKKYYDEFGLSAKIDQKLIYPLMIMKEHPIRIWMEYAEEQLEYVTNRLNELEDLIYKEIGDVNLNSPKQKVELFESFDLDTKVRTKKGNMSTGRQAIDDMIERMDNNGEKYPEWLKYLGERSKLEKLRSTYFSSIVEQAKLNDGKVRMNYRNTNASTGRLSSGKFEYN